MSSSFQNAPLPNVGNCSTTDKWSDSSMINDCKSCINASTDDDKYFYCNGKCMSEYDLNSVCSTTSLVAKTTDQCENPCVQTGNPSLSGGQCSDSFDCSPGYDCIHKTEQNKFVDRGFCVPKSTFPPSTSPSPVQFPRNLNNMQSLYNKNSLFIYVVIIAFLILGFFWSLYMTLKYGK
jgi:hypothetical protein